MVASFGRGFASFEIDDSRDGRDPSIFPKSFLADIFSLSATLAI
jgi:hypothetical protein